MSAAVRHRSKTTLIKVYNSLISTTAFTLHRKPPILQYSSYSNKTHDFLDDFSPFKHSEIVLTQKGRREIALGLAKLIKTHKSLILKEFACDFCPILLAQIIKLFENRHGSLALFKFVFRDESQNMVRACCVTCHILGMERLRIIAHDVLSWMMSRIGVTFNTLVAGYYKYGRDENVARLLQDLSVSDLLPDDSLPDVSVARLCWAGRPDEATELLEDMVRKGLPVSVIAFNSIISAYSKNGLEKKAFDVYHMMIEFGLTPPSSTCNPLLMCLSRNCKLQEAEELMLYMRDKVFPVNRVVFTVLIDGYFKTWDVMGARRLWHLMKSTNIAPDAVAFSAFIDGLSKSGRVEDAYNVFLEMKNNGLVPNNFTYNSLISGFCNGGRLKTALKLKKEMRQRGLDPDLFTNNIIINGYCKKRRMKSTFAICKNMHKIGLYLQHFAKWILQEV